MRMHRLLSICSLALVFALGTASATLAKTFNLGTITPTDPLSQSVISPAGPVNNQFTFSFTVADAPLNVYATLVNAYTQNPDLSYATGLLSYGSGSDIELFSGTPGGSHHMLTSSDLVFDTLHNDVTGQTQAFLLPAGDYFLQVLATAPSKSSGPRTLTIGGADFTVGLFVASVPEPATWAMLILGLAMIGGATRRRRGEMALAP